MHVAGKAGAVITLKIHKMLFTRVSDENDRNCEEKDFESEIPVCCWDRTH